LVPPPARYKILMLVGATLRVENARPVDAGPAPTLFTARKYTVYAVFAVRPLTVIGLAASAGLSAVQDERLNEYS
jgi:hypothetical protein